MKKLISLQEKREILGLIIENFKIGSRDSIGTAFQSLKQLGIATQSTQSLFGQFTDGTTKLGNPDFRALLKKCASELETQ